jgi:hypothetical protein
MAFWGGGQFTQSYKVVSKNFTIFFFLNQIFYWEKYKISQCGLLDLQFTPCGIKMNSKVLVVCKKNNLVLTVKFHQLT